MKKKSLLILAISAAMPMANANPPATGMTSDQAFRAALAAERSGDSATARSIAESVLRADPNHFATRDLMSRLNRQEAKARAQAPRQALDAVKIERLRLIDVTVADAIGYLRGVTRESGVNFILIDPKREIRERVIPELTLNGASAAVILDYIAQLADLRLTYTERSVEIRAGGNS